MLTATCDALLARCGLLTVSDAVEMMGLNRPIPVALQVADYLEANAEATFEREGVPIDMRT
eukprot:3101875-Alexandrium_andersonii.AAC.1